jgi:hypothetical protein
MVSHFLDYVVELIITLLEQGLYFDLKDVALKFYVLMFEYLVNELRVVNVPIVTCKVKFGHQIRSYLLI